MKLKICLAGATGWVGRELCKAIAEAPDLELVAAVARRSAGQSIADLSGFPEIDVPIFATASEALKTKPDVFVDYTSPRVVKTNVLEAIRNKIPVIIGTSGLSEDDFEEIGAAAAQQKTGVIAAGNFAISAVLLQKFARIAARYLPAWEIIDYAGAAKPDAPSGTARELAYQLQQEGQPLLDVPVSETLGFPEARGVTLNNTQVHSLRLPGYILAVEVHFGKSGERLSLRHEAGESAQPYVDGTLLAVRHVSSLTGLHRGLDVILAAD